ncbi:hypothetical protein FQA39_LY12100 [Lamprigera yunnana]|nr:hypothetical protein FQA39_LY12100 [Lamprigera yunnana]
MALSLDLANSYLRGLNSGTSSQAVQWQQTVETLTPQRNSTQNNQQPMGNFIQQISHPYVNMWEPNTFQQNSFSSYVQPSTEYLTSFPMLPTKTNVNNTTHTQQMLINTNDDNIDNMSTASSKSEVIKLNEFQEIRRSIKRKGSNNSSQLSKRPNSEISTKNRFSVLTEGANNKQSSSKDNTAEKSSAPKTVHNSDRKEPVAPNAVRNSDLKEPVVPTEVRNSDPKEPVAPTEFRNRDPKKTVDSEINSQPRSEGTNCH